MGVRLFTLGKLMPIRAINWDNATKTLTFNIGGQLHTVQKVSNDIFIDGVNVGKLTGNTAAKKAKLIAWVQQHALDTITLLTDFPADDPARLSDPDTTTFFRSDADGTKNPAGLFITGREIILVNFDETSLATDNLSATIRKA